MQPSHPAKQWFPVPMVCWQQHVALSTFTHPVAGSHESSVHGLLSLQSTAVPAVHVLVARSQVDAVVQFVAAGQSVSDRQHP